MTGILRPVTALLLATAIVTAGQGILVMILPLSASAAKFSSFSIGLMGSAYFAGILTGCLVAPAIISRVGHIRAFSAFTASVTVVPLAHTMYLDPYFWTSLRLTQGLCTAGLWLVIESWLNAASETQTRGRVLGAYTLVGLMLQTVGMQLTGMVSANGTTLFVLAAILFSLATLPISLTGAIAPMPPKRNKLRLAWLYNVSPAATLGSALTGFASGSFWILAPLYAQNAGLSSAGSAAFVSAALLAGAVAQWPLGSLSDRYGRRLVMALAAVTAMAASFVLGQLGQSRLWPIFVCSIVFGAASFPIYTIALAHANDLVAKRRAIAVSSGLLFVYSFGAASGPLIASTIVEWAGFGALFTTIAVACGLVAVVTAIRAQLRPIISARYREDYVMVPHTTPAAYGLDPRTKGPIATSIEPQSYTEPYQPAVPEVIAPEGELAER